jgi:hypothetical protein
MRSLIEALPTDFRTVRAAGDLVGMAAALVAGFCFAFVFAFVQRDEVIEGVFVDSA